MTISAGPITKYLIDKDKSLELHSEAEWTPVLGLNHLAFNSGGVECEVGEFLYGFIRMTKPLRILETGTHFGISASYIGQALKDNGFGKLTTIENQYAPFSQAITRISRLELDNYVEIHLVDVKIYDTYEKFGLIFLDTEPPTRFEELIKFYKNLEEGGYLFIHDLHRHLSQEQAPGLEYGWPFGKLPGEINRWLKEDKLRPFHFPTPRGLTGFYKVKKEDYKWHE